MRHLLCPSPHTPAAADVMLYQPLTTIQNISRSSLHPTVLYNSIYRATASHS